MELTANEAAQRPADHSARVGSFGQSAGKQVDIVDVPIDALQGSDCSSIHHVTELVKVLDGRKTAEFAPLVVARNAVIAAVLDNLCRQIQTSALKRLTAIKFP